MAELKTKPTKASVASYLTAIEDEQKRKDCKVIAKLMQDITKKKPVLWGTSIVGFDSYHYKSQRSKQEGDWPITGFSARKQNISIYIMNGFKEYEDLMQNLGKYKTGVSCLYIKKLEDIDLSLLKKIITKSVATMRKRYAQE